MTPLAKKVYKVISTIPIGQTRSYKWVAEKVGAPRAFQAIGQILKRNPYPIIIPCHRVVKSDNSLGGYVYGVGKKKELLDLEKEICISLENKE